MMQNFPALLLNADFRPLSMFPLSLKSAEEAIKNIYEDTISVVAEYDRVIRSPSMSMRLPSVVALKTYVHKHDRVAFTRHNVFLRDRFRCQYCGDTAAKLTFDHVVPRSKGGPTVWTNIVAACDPCNLRKANRTDMEPMKVPREPSPAELLALKRAVLPRFIHESWLDYIDLPSAA